MAAARHRAEISDHPAPTTPDPVPVERPRWTDPAASRPGQLAWQLVTVWLLGGFGPLALEGVTHGFELGGRAFTAATVVMLAVVSLSLMTALYVLVRATPVITPLGTTPRRRLLWTALVAAGGAVAWLTGRAIATAHELTVLHNGRLTVLLGGVLTVLVAAVLTHGWWLRIPAVAVLLVLAGTGLVVFRDSGPSELDRRLAHAGWTRDQTFVVNIPGYKPVHQTFGLAENGDDYIPTDPAATGGRIHLLSFEVTGGCRAPRCAHPDYLLLGDKPSVFAGDESRAAVHRSHSVLELTGTPGVDPELLRQALENARPARDDELLNATAPAPARDPVEALRLWLRDHT
ncbi:hypothetical protein [Actinoplanes regularis]|uniref:hypothetical protein n=1 Tax=Actinoplanes regularis TaxID=52697 RepID=UPI0025526A40|nr:hypothetical protein [Actinoplanes regularis]